jgi:hypothetical protein
VIQLRLAAIALGLLGVLPVVAGWVLTAVGPLSKAALFGPLLAILISAGLAFALDRRADGLLDAIRSTLLRPSRPIFVVGACGAMVVLASAFAWYCFGGQPGILDEMTQRFQSRMLLSGHLSLHAEPLREFFETEQAMSAGDRWFGEFPIGSAMVMTVGDLIRAPWLVNPLLAALSAWGIYHFISRTMDELTARATTLLFVASPFVLFMSGSEMNHTKTLAALMLALCGLVEWTESTSIARTRWSAAAIGAGVGLIAWMRPYDAVLVAIPIGLFQLVVLLGNRDRVSSLVWQVVAGMVPVGIMLWANAATTGHPLLFGYDLFNGTAHQPGFHTDPEGQDFTPMRGLTQTVEYFTQLNRVLLEWPLPAMVFAVITLALRRTASRWENLLLGLVATVTVGYWAYWHPGNSFGPRFLFLLVPTILLYVAQMPGAIAARVRAPLAVRTAWLTIPVCLVLAWLPIELPWPVHGVMERAQSYRYGPFPPLPDIGKQLAAAKLDHALVFVNEPWHGRLATRLRLLGVAPLRAGRIVGSFDACVLQESLDREDAPGRGSPEERLARIAQATTEAGEPTPDTLLFGAKSLAFITGRPLSPVCQQQRAADAAGTIPFDAFLPYEGFDAEGRLGGPVVFARDLGAHNEALRERFKDRTWYRYRPGADGAAAFEPYK